MKTEAEANKDEFLFPLRRKRDELYADLVKEDFGENDDECQAALTRTMGGDLEAFKAWFFDPIVESPREIYSDELNDFYIVCLEIKNLEAKLYDEAMKGR